MKKADIQRFINEYEKYNFDNLLEEEKAYFKKEYNAEITHPVLEAYEKEICYYLNQGKQSIKTIAWKMGRYYFVMNNA